MSEPGTTLLLAAGSGLVTGMRSMTLPAFLSGSLSPDDESGPLSRMLGSRSSTAVLSVLAAGEMIADKTPVIPARTDVLSVLGRGTIAALCGVTIAEQRDGSPLAAAAVSSATAVGSTVLSYRLRKMLHSQLRIPDPILGIAEDALVLVIASRLAGELED